MNTTAAAPVPSQLAPTRHLSAWPYWTWIFLILGIALRLARYLADRSLWLDETMLAWNIATRSWAGLLEPLSHNQGAPLGFLYLEKIAVTLFGAREYALRLIPLAAGIAALLLFAQVARRLLPRGPALAALLLFAVAEPLVYYSSEVKQYSTDVAVALLLLLLAIPGQSHNNGEETAETGNLDVLGLVGAVALWFSHPATFMLAGIGSALFLAAAARRRWRAAATVAAVAGGWLVSFAGHYFIALRALAANHYLRDYWLKDFLPFPPQSAADVFWYPAALLRALRELVDCPPPAPPAAVRLLAVLAATLVLLGLMHFWKRNRLAFLILTLPIVYLAAASALQKYPMRGRLILFASPILLLLVGGGLTWVRRRTDRRSVAAAAALLLAVPMGAGAIWNATFAPGRDELRPVLQYVVRRAAPEDTLFLLGGAGIGTQYYSSFDPTCMALKEHKLVGGAWEVWLPKYKDINELRAFREISSARRVWVVLSTTWHPSYRDEEERVVRLFDGAALRRDEIHVPGASAYLWDFDAPPEGRP